MVSKARKLVSNDNDYSLNFMFIIFQGFSYLKSGGFHHALDLFQNAFSLAKESALGLVESYFKLVSFYICNKKNRLCQDMVNKALYYFDSVDPQVFLFVFINSCLIPSLKENIKHVVPLLKVVEHLEGALPFAWAVKTFNTVKAILSFFSSGKKNSCFNCVGPVESLLIAPLVSRVECSNYDPFNGFV